MASPPEDRPPLAVAGIWVSRLISISLEMVVPGLAGMWLDRRLGTVAVFTLLGFGGGMVLGLWHLLRMTRSGDPQDVGESESGGSADSSDPRESEESSGRKSTPR